MKKVGWNSELFCVLFDFLRQPYENWSIDFRQLIVVNFIIILGGAYGGGCSANPTAGVISYFSYRDPNFDRTMEVFHNSNDWIQKQDNFTQRDVDEAKLNVFKAVDKPILPGARGQRLFLSGITDDQFEQHRDALTLRHKN